MSEFTKGPWKQAEYDDWLYIGGEDIDLIEYDPVNEPYNYHVENAVCVIDHVDNLTDREISNARLIAAAPDLLEACEIALSALDDPDPQAYKHAMNKCRAAIEKATGNV